MGYQRMMDEYTREHTETPVVFRSPRRKPVQRTMKDLIELKMPEETPLEAEWSDGNGYHRAPVVGAWESESGAVVLSVGKEQTVTETPPRSAE